LKNSEAAWVDGEDAPRLTKRALATGTWRIGNEIAPREEVAAVVRSRGRPAGSGTKASITIRLDVDVISAFKADGPGWQSRVNETLRQSLKLGGPASATSDLGAPRRMAARQKAAACSASEIVRKDMKRS